jgi:hypothetical protein
MEITFKVSDKEEVTTDVAPSTEQIEKAQTVCQACNEHLDPDRDFDDHEDNDSCIEDTNIDSHDTGFWCEGCRDTFTVHRVIVDKTHDQRRMRRER